MSWDGRTWRVLVPTQKNSQPSYVPNPQTVKFANGAVWLPGMHQKIHLCFLERNNASRTVVAIAQGTLSAVFRNCGLKNTHARRFRDTLVTRLLEHGATFDQVADVLGGTAEVVRRVLQLVAGPSGQHRPAHDGAFSDRVIYRSGHTPVTRKFVSISMHPNFGMHRNGIRHASSC
jgi:hypothetical protein